MAGRKRPTFGAWVLLRHLGLKGAMTQPVILSSREVGAELGFSQQTADNHLMDLAERGWVKRTLISRKQHVTMTQAGVEVLRRDFLDLKRIFEGMASLKFRGSVVSGVGEGRYYLSKEGYVKQFKDKLGYKPYAGTLNVKLDAESSSALEELRGIPGIRIDGFQAEGRTFGGATCFKANLKGRKCDLILPDRTHYQNVLEFISPRSLRRVGHFRDGDKVEMEVRM